LLILGGDMLRFIQRLIGKKAVGQEITAMPLDERIPESVGPAENPAEVPVKNILVYAPENVGIREPATKIRSRIFSLSFESFNTQKRFNEYDGIIVFQGCFETFHKEATFDGPYFTNIWDKDELDKRLKELDLLFDKGGFICVLLHQPFFDEYKGKDWSYTDLAKRLLNIKSLYRNNTSVRIPRIRCHRNEFKNFLDLYGAACTTFSCSNRDIDLKPIATYGNELTGMILWGERFFVPVLLPDAAGRVDEFFSLLAEALVSARIKLINELPEWASKFNFAEEASLLAKRTEALSLIDQISTRLEVFQNFKRILAQGDAQLVDSVTYVLEKGFGFRVNQLDEYKEDLKLLDDSEKPIVFCEVKGVNRGVAREYVNQADSHRERASLPPSFPSVLIINTHMKNSRNLEEKDQEVPLDQVIHANKNNVLILRTLDLLRLLHIKSNQNIAKETILGLLSSGGGWLKVNMDKWELIKGQ
jgi:hypothetical protein